MIRRLLAALLFVLAPVAAQADERILSFDSQVAVQKDGSVDVTETIRVRAENVSINRGIFRDFPTRYDSPRGKRVRVGFELISTERDGQREPSRVERLSNGVRIRIGDPDVVIPVGEHVYRIRYKATRELGYFDGYDELYWNATGHGWAFPIDRASATITLPSPVRFGQRASYTGPYGTRTTSATVTRDEPGLIRFETTAPLGPKEGLTVAAAFPTGVIAAPSAGKRLGWFIADWAPPIIAAGGLVALIAFLLAAYRRVGRDPPEGTVVPIFSPPDGLTPSAMRYVVNKGLDDRAFAAALIDAAVKGEVRLREESSGLFGMGKDRVIERPLVATGHAASTLWSESAEKASLDALVARGDEISMEKENHKAFSSAKKTLSDRYDKRFEGTAFHRNLGWAFAAMGVWLATVWATAAVILVADGLPEAKLALAAAFLFGLAAMVWGLLPSRTGTVGCLFKAVPFVLVAIGLLLSLPTIPAALAAGRWIPRGSAALGLPVALSTFGWIDAPTKEGRAMLDRIAGFKQYLSITERERLDRMHAPEDTIETFEKYLPYAIALDVENRWAERFENVLKAAMAAPGGASAFGWYSGSSSPWTDTGDFVDSIGSSLATSVSSASTAPGSSSGSGGGGFSGGGGGGGGGGGW